MRFYTEKECAEWLSRQKRQKPDQVQGLITEKFDYPKAFSRMMYMAYWIASSVMFRKPALLWITEWGIWGESCSHLYYKLRQSYSDYRLLEEAPGHLFLGHETEDFTSFLQLAMLDGWGGYIITEIGHIDAFFSHDEFFRFYTTHDVNFVELREAFRDEPQRPK